MFDLESLVQKTIDLESKYYELLDKYQSLINEYEKLKDESRNRPGNQHESLKDSCGEDNRPGHRGS
jgi:predicted nuclease with TOPRIM domain